MVFQYGKRNNIRFLSLKICHSKGNNKIKYNPKIENIVNLGVSEKLNIVYV